ncbi:hypothetical protein Ahia01_000077700 [Argonauta hians]
MDIPNVFGPSKKQFNPARQQRLEQISKVFYHYISDLIQFQDENIAQENIEISKVKIDYDFTAVTVYWMATGTERDDIIQEMLTRKSSYIRQYLINYRLVGTVPPVVFVPDKTSVKYQEILKLLKNADMGPGFQSTTDGDSLKSEPKVIISDLKTSLPNNQYDYDLDNKDETKAITTEESPSTDITAQFTYQSYDLNYTRLINKVKGNHEILKLNVAENSKIPDDKYLKSLQRNKMANRKLSEYTYDQYFRDHNNENEFD